GGPQSKNRFPDRLSAPVQLLSARRPSSLFASCSVGGLSGFRLTCTATPPPSVASRQMKAQPALILCSVVLVVTFNASGAAPDGPSGDAISAAQKSLETARANLAKAVQRIEVDPPSVGDLDAAHEAVEALKDAIDAGAQHEANDLAYAKTALAA